ncbi:hypothetical protein H0O00_03375 [Candidatus Micrarchaeota archaeon]|nr:hypothetical protein [Candidatus Micrarchaeota archaeon]
MQLWSAWLFLFLMLPAAFAAPQKLDLTFAVPLVAVIVAIFLALMGMLSRTISDPRLEAWTKTEIRELLAGVILVVIITAFFIGTEGVTVTLTGKSDPVGAAVGVIDGLIGKYDTSYSYIIQAATKIRAAATYAPYTSIPLWYVSITYSTNPLGGVGLMMNPLNAATQGLTNIIYLSEGMRLLLLFLKAVVPPVILPLAMVLRLIPFTRKSGNTLIAVSLAAIVIFPFSVVLAGELNRTLGPDLPDPSIKDLSELNANPWGMVAVEPLCESVPIRLLLGATDPLFAVMVCSPLLLIIPIGGALFAICWNAVMYVVYPYILTVFQIAMTTVVVLWELSLGGGDSYAMGVYGQVHPFLTDLNNLILLSYIDFIVIATVTIVAARSLSSALGGEAYMAGIQRLI